MASFIAAHPPFLIPMSLYRFEDYLLDPRTRRLLHAGAEVGVEPRVFDLIVYLVEQRTRAVGRDELIAAAWGRTDSSDGTLAQAVLKARRLLGDDGSSQHAIRTVARFGYQWVAATDEVVPCSTVPVANAIEPAATAVQSVAPAVAIAVDTDFARARPLLRRMPAMVLLLAVLAATTATFSYLHVARTHAAAAADHAPARVAGLIAIAPAQVRSAVAQDGWMRLGLMAMSADALRALPHHAVVPNETVLATIGQQTGPVDIQRLRQATGATTIVTLDARHDGADWLIEADVSAAGGKSQAIEARAVDPVAAANALRSRLRDAFDAGSRTESTTAPGVLDLAARMQAATLEGHAERALEISDSAPLASAPEIILLRAKAMNRLGRAPAAAASLRTLIARAGASKPAWLAEAWTTVGYSELVVGDDAVAEQAFRHSLDVLGDDRVEAGRAWRGLGNAQAARGRLDDAEASYLRARLQLSDSGDRLLLAHILDDLGSVAARRGRLAEAVGRYHAAADAAAALGASEVELGARMNVALTEQQQLQHAAALSSWQALLPRIRAMSYPAMQRYAEVHFADALAETGDVHDAVAALDRFDASNEDAAAADALEDARLSALQVRLALGEAPQVVEPAFALWNSPASPDQHAAAGTLALSAQMAAGRDSSAAPIAAALPATLATASDSVHAGGLDVLARWQAHNGEASLADSTFRQALSMVRRSGSPRELRDVAVDYATFQLGAGNDEAARNTAALLQPYAADDFPITLLFARIALRDRDPLRANRLRERAQALAGARWTSGLAAELAAPAPDAQVSFVVE